MKAKTDLRSILGKSPASFEKEKEIKDKIDKN
jgi:hypothetical protein